MILYLSLPATEFYKRKCMNNGASFWNYLPSKLHGLNNRETVKQHLKKHMYVVL